LERASAHFPRPPGALLPKDCQTFAGIAVPVGIQGKSLVDLLTGQTTTHRSIVNTEYLDAHALFGVPPNMFKRPNGSYKIANYQGIHTGEPYNLQRDQTEAENSWSSVHHSDVKEKIMEYLVDTMLSTTDPLPQRRVLW
jgi:arylsulfatase